jgi:hypothetical protein
MFGMENKKALFEFDLEMALKKDPQKKQALLKEVETKVQELKNTLRDGTETAEFDQYGVLLHGYSALQKVLNRLPTNTKGDRS